MFRAQLAILVCFVAYVHASSSSASDDANPSNDTEPLASNYLDCDYGYYDLRYSYSESFYDYKTAVRRDAKLPNQNQVQCQDSPYCSTYAAKIFSVTCTNANRGSSSISWNCNPIFHGSGYSVRSSNINCESYPRNTPCTLRDSCIFTYTPQPTSPPDPRRKSTSGIYIFTGFGGFFVLCFVGLAIFLCVQRRTRLMNSRGNTTTTYIANAPPVAIPTQASTSAGAYPTAPCYPSEQDCPPPYTAPYPQYVPQYAPPEPPKQAPRWG